MSDIHTKIVKTRLMLKQAQEKKSYYVDPAVIGMIVGHGIKQRPHKAEQTGRGALYGQTIGLGAGLGGSLGALGGGLATLPFGGFGAVPGFVAGAGLGGYGGYRLGKAILGKPLHGIPEVSKVIEDEHTKKKEEKSKDETEKSKDKTEESKDNTKEAGIPTILGALLGAGFAPKGFKRYGAGRGALLGTGTGMGILGGSLLGSLAGALARGNNGGFGPVIGGALAGGTLGGLGGYGITRYLAGPAAYHNPKVRDAMKKYRQRLIAEEK